MVSRKNIVSTLMIPGFLFGLNSCNKSSEENCKVLEDIGYAIFSDVKKDKPYLVLYGNGEKLFEGYLHKRPKDMDKDMFMELKKAYAISQAEGISCEDYHKQKVLEKERERIEELSKKL